MSKLSVRAKHPFPIRGDDHVAGPETAAITLVTYCDFECPYCGHAYPIIKRLQARLTNRLRVVFRHFPLIEKHPLAQQAAEAAEAAGSQGQFWAMHDLLFENQDALEQDDLHAYVESLDLDVETFDRELEARVYGARVNRDVESGRWNGVTGTPTFFINGARHTDEGTAERVVLRMMKGVSYDSLAKENPTGH